MGKRLYVANLPYETTELKIREFFGNYVQNRQHGRIESVKMIMDRDSGKFRGFAFVELETDGEVAAAIADLDGKEMDGRDIKVAEANEKPQLGRGRGGNHDRDRDRNGYGKGRGRRDDHGWDR